MFETKNTCFSEETVASSPDVAYNGTPATEKPCTEDVPEVTDFFPETLATTLQTELSDSINSDIVLDVPFSNPETNSLKGKFLNNEQLLEIVLDDGIERVDTIPKGLKVNVYFVTVNNLIGEASNKSKQKRKFVDDCGAWIGNCKSVKRDLMHLDPQHLPSEIFTMTRYYTKPQKHQAIKGE